MTEEQRRDFKFIQFLLVWSIAILLAVYGKTIYMNYEIKAIKKQLYDIRMKNEVWECRGDKVEVFHFSSAELSPVE